MENKEIFSIWKDEYIVSSYHTDFTGKAPLQSLCTFLQESAWNNANHLGFGYDDLLQNKRIWVLSRLLIKIYDYPRMGEKIYVQTWPSGIDGMFALRDFEIFNEKNEKLASAVSAWIVLNMETRRPIRTNSIDGLSEHIIQRRSLDIKMDKIQYPENPINKGWVTAVYSDLDVNNHVNNTKYIEWILNSYSLDFLRLKQPVELELNFLSETYHGDKINILSKESDDSVHFHVLIRESDKKEICKARILWESIKI
jgi:medium-chain acyl-[acyl-carrier-protein] hydrolase